MSDMVRGLILALALALPSSVWAQLRAEDMSRLGPSAVELRAIIERAKQAQLPTDLLLDKAREGLAKSVPPARIVAVVAGLEQSLGRARAEAQPFVGPTPARALLQALVEAHAAGVQANDSAAVLRAGGRERALQVLTDLVQRGYPSGPAARAVAGFAGTKAAALERLVGQAERLRGLDDAPRAEVLDALARANAQGLGLEHAEQLLHGDRGNGAGGRGPERETSGARGPRSGGVAAPGQGTGKTPR
jgi:hypothetical protein